MSTQNPNAPRPRRRIAGERKGQRGVPATGTTEPAGTTAPPGPDSPDSPAAPVRPKKSRPAPAPRAPSTAAQPVAQSVGERTRTEARPVPGPVLAGLAALAAVLVALAAGPFVEGMGWQDYRQVAQQDDLDSARRTAPALAERAAAAILAYDYKSLESDRNAAARFMTPDYRKEYVDTFDALVLDQAPKQKAHVEASVRASGVTAAGAERVEVLLFVNQTTTSTANSGEPQTALNRVVFSMVRQDDTWRVDDITPL
jgi:Mce-associated membrane protein